MPIRLQANNGNIDLKVPIRGGGIEQVQADWAQNDETAKDYIKNRFGGYVENGVATTLYDATPDSDGGVEITFFPLNTKVGTITIDGVATTYTCVTETIQQQQCVSFGTATLAEVYSGTTDAIVAASTGTISMALIGSSYVGKHIVISIDGEVVHTIPIKFIDNNFVNKVNNAVSMATAAQKDVDEIKSDGLSYTDRLERVAFIGLDEYNNAIVRVGKQGSDLGRTEINSGSIQLAQYNNVSQLKNYVILSTIGTTDKPVLLLKPKAKISGVNEPEDDTDAATKKYVDTQLAAATPSGGFLCTITGAGTDASPYVCDKTYDEISAAVDNGQIPYCIHPSSIGKTYGDNDLVLYYLERVVTPYSSYHVFRSMYRFSIGATEMAQDIYIHQNGNVTIVEGTVYSVLQVNGKTGNVTLKTSDLENDSGYALKSELPTVPTNVSALTNDSGYLTLATLPKYTGGVE